MFRLGHIQFLYAFAAIPVLIIIFIMMRQWKKRAMKAYGETNIIGKLMPDVSRSKATLKFVLLLVALAFLIIGIVDPQIGSGEKNVKRKGADIMIALDVSNSMNAQDIQPSRLAAAKQAIENLINHLRGDRVGIVVFAGEAYVQLPITTDYDAAKLFLDPISTDMIPTQGTAIGSAINLCVKSFGNLNADDKKSKAIILITDGENHQDDAVKAAQDAANKGIIIHTIGMGSPQGAPIPIYSNGHQTGFMKDQQGNTVVTKLDQSMLEQIASIGHGIYIRANNADTGLETVLAQIRKMNKKEISSKVFRDYEDQFEYFLAVAFFLLLLDIFITERKTLWFERLNLFGEKK